MNICTVCKNDKIEFFINIKGLDYWQCTICKATMLNPVQFISSNKEKKHYLKHNNEINDTRYRSFVSNLIKPLKDKISVDDMGLDYGCGYAPALADILKKDGFNVELYDPFFFKNEDIFLRKFNFITCSEVVEHFFEPYEEFNKINSLLKKNSWLAIMTSFMTENYLFKNWHYRRDPTHVVFYKRITFKIIANQRNWKINFPSNNIVLFNKK
tara:strand:- start:1342 stop:1977 length:636 start_codon:yes stop_codon:yes gene_type:complete